mgnify:CR=1 FL=1
MKVGVKILFLAATLAAVGCAEEYSENRADSPAAKVLNQPDASGENPLIVDISSNVAVPTEMDRIAESAGAVSYDRVFQKLASSESEICWVYTPRKAFCRQAFPYPCSCPQR